jgi:hypothetical protein
MGSTGPNRPALAAARPDQDHGAVACDVLEVGACDLPGQDGAHTRENSSLNQVAPVEMTGRGMIGHLTGLSS